MPWRRVRWRSVLAACLLLAPGPGGCKVLLEPDPKHAQEAGADAASLVETGPGVDLGLGDDRVPDAAPGEDLEIDVAFVFDLGSGWETSLDAGFSSLDAAPALDGDAAVPDL